MTLPLHESWRNPASISSDFFRSNGSLLVFITRNRNGTHQQINVLKANNGTLLWRTDPIQLSIKAVTIDQQKLYFASSSRILAYDIATGKVLWEVLEALPDRTQHEMYVTGNQLMIYSIGSSASGHTKRVVRTFDTQSGALKNLEDESFPKNAGLLFKTNSIDYWTDRSSVWSVDRATKQELWNIPLDGPVQYQPVIFGDEFVFASGIFSDVIAINKKTGKHIWKYAKKVVSNLALQSETIYAVREDAAITSINVYTGEEVGNIFISPSFTEDRNSRSIPYLVTATKDMVFVYYGDSKEIIAFSK